MIQLNDIILAETDYHKILGILKLTQTDAAELLEEELGRALLVSDQDLPKDVVGMGATVVYEDVEENKKTEVKLVYPHEANIEENKISVLSPIGSALIGLKVGQAIRWPLPSGKIKHLQILSVTAKN